MEHDRWVRTKKLFGSPRFEITMSPVVREITGDLAAILFDTLVQRQHSAPKDALAELTGMVLGHAEAPTNPGLLRLLPDFSDATMAASESNPFDGQGEDIAANNSAHRQLNEPEIIAGKLTGLFAITNEIGPDGGCHVSISPEEAGDWIRGLNDVRLYFSEQYRLLQTGDLRGDEDLVDEALAMSPPLVLRPGDVRDPQAEAKYLDFALNIIGMQVQDLTELMLDNVGDEGNDDEAP